MRRESINKEAFRSQIDDAPQDDDPVEAETLLYLRTRPTYFTAGDGEGLQDGVHDDHDIRPYSFKKQGAFVSGLRGRIEGREKFVYEEVGRECVV